MNEEQDDKINLFNEIFIKGQVYKNVLEKKEIWKEIAEKLNGKFKIKQTISKDLISFILEIPYKNQKLILTETDSKALKSEINLELKEKFEFNISWEGGIEKIMKFFGSQDIKIGVVEFDKKYLIQSNNSERTIEILINLKDLILELNIYLINLQHENSKDHKIIITKDRNTQSLKEMLGFIELNFKLIDNLI